MTFRKYQHEDLVSLYNSFVLAFSTNQTPISLSEENFTARLYQKLKIVPEASFLCIAEERVVGFNLHTLGSYEGKQTAYNGGIGVIPGYRNRGIAEKLCLRAVDEFKKKNVVRVLLEVVSSNKPALALYTNLGFQFRRKFKCFRMIKKGKPQTSPFSIRQVDIIPNVGEMDFIPGFVDEGGHLDASYETILAAFSEGKEIGYIVFQPRFGRISQLMVHIEFRRRGVAGALIAEASGRSAFQMTIMNIPEDQFEMIKALEKLGFENEIDQLELELII